MDAEAEVVANINEEIYDYTSPAQDDLSLPLIYAANAGDLMTVQSLLEKGAEVNETTDNGRTALFHAAWSQRNSAFKGHSDVVKLLLEYGADKDKADKWLTTPLHIASGIGHLAAVHLLVEHGANLESADDGRTTPLYVASNEGEEEVVRYLLEQGADRDKVDEVGFTPLHIAVLNNLLEITKLLMVYGADLNARTNHGELPIDLARTEVIKQAIRDEPRRRMDHGYKRATEQDRHPNAAAASASAQQEEEEQSNKQPHLDEGAVPVPVVAEEET